MGLLQIKQCIRIMTAGRLKTAGRMFDILDLNNSWVICSVNNIYYLMWVRINYNGKKWWNRSHKHQLDRKRRWKRENKIWVQNKYKIYIKQIYLQLIFQCFVDLVIRKKGTLSFEILVWFKFTAENYKLIRNLKCKYLFSVSMN